MIVSGFLVAENNKNENLRDLFRDEFWTGVALVSGGIVLDIVSIPLFISAGRNARKAADISLQPQNIRWPDGSQRIQPAMALHIHF